MLKEIIAKALEVEKEAASRISLAQNQCTAEEFKENMASRDAIKQCQDRLQKDLLRTIEVFEKQNEENIRIHIRQKGEEVNTFLDKHRTQVQQIAQNICTLICNPTLSGGENLPHA